MADLLAAAERFLAAYDRETPALLAEERSQQTQNLFNQKQEQRVLRSNVLMFRADDEPVWIRDVVEVNGQKVVAEPERLMAIVNTPPAQPAVPLLRIAVEGANQQFGGVFRAINVPGLALGYLRAGKPENLNFKHDGMKTIDGTRTALLVLKDAPGADVLSFAVGSVQGRFWIEPTSGRVVQTELEFVMLSVFRSKITVRYGIDKALNAAVPVLMNDEYENRGALITGRAEYRNFRKVTVDASAFSIKR